MSFWKTKLAHKSMMTFYTIAYTIFFFFEKAIEISTKTIEILIVSVEKWNCVSLCAQRHYVLVRKPTFSKNV